MNSTKYFHASDKSSVVDVPTLKLSRCYDFCGNIAQTDYLAAMVRFID